MTWFEGITTLKRDIVFIYVLCPIGINDLIWRDYDVLAYNLRGPAKSSIGINDLIWRDYDSYIF